jgi:hypothetical protein
MIQLFDSAPDLCPCVHQSVFRCDDACCICMHESWEDEASRPIFPLYTQINQIKSKYSTCHPRGLTYLPKQLELKRTLGTRSRYIELCTVHSTSILCMHACMYTYRVRVHLVRVKLDGGASRRRTWGGSGHAAGRLTSPDFICLMMIVVVMAPLACSGVISTRK